MPNAKISALPPATSVLTTDEFPINQDGTTKKVTLEQIQNSVSFPTGGIMMFAVSGVPTGWLECNGSVLAINKYTNLYNIIGQNYKTLNNFNTLSGFQIPDLRGEFVRGWDHGKGVDAGRQIGSSQKATGVRFLIDQYVGNASYPLGTFAINMGEIDGLISGYPTKTYTVGSDTTFYQAQNTIAKTGSSDNSMATVRPRNVALVYCIKV
jgi:microcystin-dependent protein